jgi:hypothetical protein
MSNSELDLTLLLEAATKRRGSEDDMYCTRHVPALIAEIERLERRVRELTVQRDNAIAAYHANRDQR